MTEDEFDRMEHSELVAHCVRLEREIEQAREDAQQFLDVADVLMAADEDYGDAPVTPADVVRRLLKQRDETRVALAECVELAEELFQYAIDGWDYKYGKEWRAQLAAAKAALK